VDYGGAPTALANVERHPDVRRVTLSSDEFLLLENRWLAPADTVELDQDSLTHVILGPKRPDRYEYDALLPGSGVLVWHVDDSVIPYSTSLRVNPDYGFNTDPDRYGVSVLEADGLADLGDPGSPYLFGAPFDPWFASNNAMLSDSSFPDLLPHTGTRPHRRLEFLDDPDTTVHFTARRAWEREGWPVEAKFPPGGPLLLAVDADGDGRREVCWAGGPDSTVMLPDSSIVPVGDRTAPRSSRCAPTGPRWAARTTSPSPGSTGGRGPSWPLWPSAPRARGPRSSPSPPTPPDPTPAAPAGASGCSTTRAHRGPAGPRRCRRSS
jgi:hypothetical protein